MFYKRVELKEGVEVQFLGVYATKWKHVLGHLDKLTVGFVEVSDEEIVEYLKKRGRKCQQRFSR